MFLLCCGDPGQSVSRPEDKQAGSESVDGEGYTGEANVEKCVDAFEPAVDDVKAGDPKGTGAKSPVREASPRAVHRIASPRTAAAAGAAARARDATAEGAVAEGVLQKEEERPPSPAPEHPEGGKPKQDDLKTTVLRCSQNKGTESGAVVKNVGWRDVTELGADEPEGEAREKARNTLRSRMSQRCQSVVDQLEHIGMSVKTQEAISQYFEVEEDNGWQKKFALFSSPTEKFQLQKPTSPIVLIKGVGVADSTIGEVWSFFYGNEFKKVMKTCDGMFDDGGVLETLHSDDRVMCRIVWGRFMTGFAPIIANRDFTWMEKTIRLDDQRMLAVGKSIDRLDLHPLDPNAVRGTIMNSGYLFEQLPTGGVRITYIVQVDPAGYLPTRVVNIVAADQADNVTTIIKYFKEIRDAEKKGKK